MALTLTFLIGFYRKYMEYEKENVQLLNFGAFARNLIFVWAHLTNHCNNNRIIKNINSIIDSNGFFLFLAYFIRLDSRRALLIVVGVWCLITVVLANAYAGCLLSFMSVNKLGPIINSLDELALSKDTQLVAQGGADITNLFIVNYN